MSSLEFFARLWKARFYASGRGAARRPLRAARPAGMTSAMMGSLRASS